MRKLKNKEGFSLIEILLILGVIVTLSIVVFMVYSKVDRQYELAKVSEIVSESKALVAHYDSIENLVDQNNSADFREQYTEDFKKIIADKKSKYISTNQSTLYHTSMGNFFIEGEYRYPYVLFFQTKTGDDCFNLVKLIQGHSEAILTQSGELKPVSDKEILAACTPEKGNEENFMYNFDFILNDTTGAHIGFTGKNNQW